MNVNYNKYTELQILRLERFIDTANKWLAANRSSFNLITVERVLNRMSTNTSLLGVETDSKTKKGSKNGYLTGILYLAPHKITGFNVCSMAKTCINDCLFNAGRGQFGGVTEARIIKTLIFLLDIEFFKAILTRDIQRVVNKADKKGMTPVIRLNGTSDLIIERVFKDVLNKFNTVQFYDYTKIPNRRKLPSNYDLTFSYDGVNGVETELFLKRGGRVSVVFKNELPETFMGYPVINGDSSDLRFLDSGGVVVGLVAKGSAKKDSANDSFVVCPKSDNRCKLSA